MAIEADALVDVDDLRNLASSWRRYLRAKGRAPATIKNYLGSLATFGDFLSERGMPLQAGRITREHVEMFLIDIMERRTASTAARTTQNICASLGQSGSYDCGDVLDYPAVHCCTTGRIRVDMDAVGGDSGAGGKWGSTARGILTDTNEITSLFQPIYHVVGSSYLNRDINCVYSGSWWATCPIV